MRKTGWYSIRKPLTIQGHCKGMGLIYSISSSKNTD